MILTKTTLVMASLLALLFITIPQISFSEADGPDYWKIHGVESGDVLNIRREANWKSEKVGQIPSNGQCIKNLRCIGGLTYDEFTNFSEAEKDKVKKDRPRWRHIEYKGTKGWVAGRYLREGSCEKEPN